MNQATAAKAAPTQEASKEIPEKQPSIEQIRERAYKIYVSRAGAPGDELQDWLQAERELRSK
jgi:hypothetical protein